MFLRNLLSLAKLLRLLFGFRGAVHPVITKGAIEAFTYTLTTELASQGISINTIDPVPTDTGLMTEAVQQGLLSGFLMGRLGQLEEAGWVTKAIASKW